MQHIALRQIARERLRQAQRGEPLALAERHFAQHAPARPEAQMRLLGRAQRRGALGRAPVRAARRDPGEIDRARLRVRRQHQARLRVQLERGAAFRHTGAADREPVAFFGPRQPHPDVARLARIDLQRAQEEQVADLEGAGLAMRAQRLGGQLDEAGPRHDRIARPGPVLVEQPVRLGGEPRGEHPRAGVVEGGAIEQRRVGGLDRRRRPLAAARGDRLRRHAAAVPDAPVDGDHARGPAGAAARIGVQVFVGGDVIHLPGRPGHRAGRGEQRQPVERAVGEQRVQHLRAVDLRGEHVLDVGDGLGQQRRVLHGARGVDHRMNPAEPLGGERDGGAHLLEVAHIGRRDQHLGPERFQPLRRADAH